MTNKTFLEIYFCQLQRLLQLKRVKSKHGSGIKTKLSSPLYILLSILVLSIFHLVITYLKADRQKFSIEKALRGLFLMWLLVFVHTTILRLLLLNISRKAPRPFVIINTFFFSYLYHLFTYFFYIPGFFFAFIPITLQLFSLYQNNRLCFSNLLVLRCVFCLLSTIVTTTSIALNNIINYSIDENITVHDMIRDLEENNFIVVLRKLLS